MNCIIQIWHSQNSPSYCLLTPLLSPKDKKCNVCMYVVLTEVTDPVWRVRYFHHCWARKSWVEDFLFDTNHSSLQLYRTVYKANHSFYQPGSTLNICLLSDAILTGDWSVGSGVVAMAYMLTQAASAKIVNIAAENRVCLVCMSGSVDLL